jgi:serine/threonine protein phosphatase PrpC
MAARCEAAGRPDNEDNYHANDNLHDDQWGFTTDREVELSAEGALLVVADGMGGMNAGEVASAIAIEVIKKWFSSEKLTKKARSSPASIKQHIRRAIQAADRAIKTESAADKNKRGMGSTIVLAWLTGEKVYVGWCGDSRAYRFNPVDGLIQLSHDHSYVQSLVDTGQLTPDLAFDFPDNNIITRSLGDTHEKANPDIREFPLREGDILLLCSDGLSGVLRDRDIEKVISENTYSLEAVRDALWNTSCEAGWNDNVTLALCQIISVEQQSSEEAQPHDIKPTGIDCRKKRKSKKWVEYLLFLLLGIATGGSLCAYFFFEVKPAGTEKVRQEEPATEQTALSHQIDSLLNACDSLSGKITAIRDSLKMSEKINRGLREETRQLKEKSEERLSEPSEKEQKVTENIEGNESENEN